MPQSTPQPRVYSNALDDLHNLVKPGLGSVNDIIMSKMMSDIPLVPEIINYLINAGGKRIRPMLTLATAELVGYMGKEHHQLAASVEFIHTATLLHDDVVDESDMRRGKAAAHTVWGNPATVLVGDFLFARSFEMMVAVESIEVLKILSRASAIIIEGEVMQLLAANDVNSDQNAYLKVINSKTAELFAAACQVSAVLADKDQATRQTLENYGRYLGISFQLADDVLDYKADSKVLGKDIGDDFQEGKMTLPVVLAYQAGTEEEKLFWQRTINRLEQTEDDFDRAVEIMDKHNVFERTIDLAIEYAAKAREEIAKFPTSPVQQSLLALTDYSYQRVS